MIYWIREHHTFGGFTLSVVFCFLIEYRNKTKHENKVKKMYPFFFSLIPFCILLCSKTCLSARVGLWLLFFSLSHLLCWLLIDLTYLWQMPVAKKTTMELRQTEYYVKYLSMDQHEFDRRSDTNLTNWEWDILQCRNIKIEQNIIFHKNTQQSHNDNFSLPFEKKKTKEF